MSCDIHIRLLCVVTSNQAAFLCVVQISVATHFLLRENLERSKNQILLTINYENSQKGTDVMEKKIIEAKFQKNKTAFVIGFIAIVLFLMCALKISSQYESDNLHAQMFNYDNLTLGEYIFERIFSTYFGLDVFLLFWVGVLLVITFGVLMLMMNHCELIISNTRVTGKTSFGKHVDLPVNQISAISMGIFNRITVATSSGGINFWLVENREEIHKALNSLIEDIQVNHKTKQTNVTHINSADELKKFKDLLDSGVITQEEFDTKKKQLLGL